MILRNCGPQQDTEIESRTLGRRPRSLQTPSACGLLIREDREAFRGALRSQPGEFGVGGRQRIESQNLWFEECHGRHRF